MKRAIVSVTTGGLATSRKIQKELGGDIFTLDQYCLGTGFHPMKMGLKEFMGSIFFDYRELIMVMSCGIAVRSIAPYLQSKLTDPAVVVLDEKGNHVISLISGHIGGANELAQKVASITGGKAVITTASDNLGLESVDMIAKKYHLMMEDLEQVKKVTSCMVNGQKVILVNESGLDLNVPFSRLVWDRVSPEKPDAIIYVGHKQDLCGNNRGIPTAKLLAQNLVIGVGCRKDTDPDKLKEAVRALFERHNYSLAAVRALATVDVKKDEPAIKKLAEQMSLELVIVNRTEISPIENRFSCSEFVKKTIGVGCACEPAAYIASGQGKQLIPKTTFNGITLCVYEDLRASCGKE